MKSWLLKSTKSKNKTQSNHRLNIIGRIASFRVINLKLSDINSKLMQIENPWSKGKKDRLVPLTERTREILGCIISSTNHRCIYSTVNLVCNTDKLQRNRKKIHRQYHMHTLRHSAATGLYEKELISN
jgi:integrase